MPADLAGINVNGENKGLTTVQKVSKDGPRLSDELRRDISTMAAVVAETELEIAEIMARFKEKGMSPFVEPDKNQADMLCWWGELHHQQTRLTTAQLRLSSLLLESLQESVSRLDSSIQISKSSESKRRAKPSPKSRPLMRKKRPDD